ncbi:CHAT domain-containing protein [Streptomyces sp. NPDC002888]|uniref:CHAT domain-containing protein n=1 Tax=Streptomyces sp. NPDC002888 TaxID=3364668 RepID=UPI0036B773DC
MGLKKGIALPEAPHVAMALGLLYGIKPDAVDGQLWELAVEFGADPAARAKFANSLVQAEQKEGEDPFSFLVVLERAVSELPPDHPDRCSYCLVLAVYWLERFDVSADAGDLDRAERWGREALRLSTIGAPHRLGALHLLVLTLTKKVARQNTVDDARAAVEMCRKFLAVATSDHAQHLGVRFALGGALVSRFRHTQARRDLWEAVDVLRGAVSDARSTKGLEREQLRSLAAALYKRYVQGHAQEDLDESLRVAKEAATLGADRRSPSAVSMASQVRALEAERASGRAVPTADLPHPDPSTPRSRAEEAWSLLARAEADDDALARDRGIELMCTALHELPQDFPDRARYGAFVGEALVHRYRSGGNDPADLHEAEKLARRAVRLCPAADGSQSHFRTVLAMIADARYEGTGNSADLDTAIGQWRALLSRPFPSPRHRRETLNHLGVRLSERFGRTGSLADVDDAVEALRLAQAVDGQTQEERGTSALNLATALLLRRQHTGAVRDLDEARVCLVTARHRLPPEDDGQAYANELLDTVMKGLRESRTRYEDTVAPLLAESRFVPASSDRPAVPPEQAGVAQDQGAVVLQYKSFIGALGERFEKTGDVSALEACVDTGRRVLTGMPATHPHRPTISAVLGLGLLFRFEYYGERQDIDAAVEHLREAAYGLEPGGDRGKELSALAGAHLRRFERDGSNGDLEEAVASARRAVEATPADRTVALDSRLQMLGLVLLVRHRHTGDLADLDQAIELGRRVLELGPNPTGAQARSAERRRSALSALCNRLRTRYLAVDSAEDLEEAIALGREAVRLMPRGTPDTILLMNVALALWDRHGLRGNSVDLDEAIDLVLTAAPTLHDSSPRSAHVLRTLASMLRDRSACGSAISDPDDAARSLALFREAADAHTSPPVDRLDAAASWGAFAAERAAEGLGTWAEAADGFAAAVALLPLTTWRGLPRTDRERLLARHANLATDAAACAISCGRLEQAVEMLDQGRSVLWGQALDIRADLTELRGAHPEKAARFEDLQAALSEVSESPTARGDTAERQRRLTREWETVLGEIRRLPGFAHFLKAPPFPDLSMATAGGPMILVNVSRYRCDALVVTPGEVRLLPLPGLTAEQAQDRTELYLAALERLNEPGAAVGLTQQAVLDTLEWLWDEVAAPVLDSPLARTWRGRRMWWCATGPLALLPLHAAGYHDPDDERAYDAVVERVVSSYMPTLRGLGRAQRPVAASDRVRRLLILALEDRPPYAQHLAPLPGARREAESLRRRFPERHTALLDGAATTERVRELLDAHSCVHFACHAGQDLADPSRGALYLQDGPLTVTDLARLRLGTPELAVLSACQTAVGGTDLPNEAIHLAGALLLCDFRHVVSTLWPVGDESTRRITDEMYAELADETGRIDASRAARALHTAAREARGRDPLKPLTWASHVHFGP